VIIDGGVWEEELEGHVPIWSIKKFKALEENKGSVISHFLRLNTDEVDEFLELESARKNCVVVLRSNEDKPLSDLRNAIKKIEEAGVSSPIILQNTIDGEVIEKFTLYQSIDSGALLLDGKLDGIWIEGSGVSLVERNRMSFGILQATRTRISKTEYISCPSCGRTLFDLEETTAKIRNATSHLKGLKIGIMGCIVNGPGEMADADFGYVGTGVGKITLYREREVVRKNVPESEGVQALIDLIKSEGKWVNPSQ
jgi:(E)-4-hydroxy-3-methylbut-2-enyl-diphosphate synthase